MIAATPAKLKRVLLIIAHYNTYNIHIQLLRYEYMNLNTPVMR